MYYALQKRLNPHLHDLNPIFTGEAACPPEETHTSAKDNYQCIIIHYVRSGCGIFYLDDTAYPVHAGQAFIIIPGTNVAYVADKKDPWVYAWVGFTGALSDKFSSLPPVFDVPEDMFLHLRTPFDWTQMDEYWGYQLATDLLLFYAKVLRPQAKKVDYVQEILDHVQLFYMEKLSVEAFARQYGLDRRHLTRQFKKKIGCTIQDYILRVRMYEGCRYLRMGYSVKETATLCGYSSAPIFSKLFKREHGFSPTDWKARTDQNVVKQIGLMGRT
ncbi:MAG: AraC family transcriptional regulator [Oscillospiraceae bacterium]|nr:AraC family transcriptional regulator [Oscillospiraceae bacterium]